MNGLTPAPLRTAEDLAQLPDDGRLYELDQGRVVCMAPASWIPGVVGARVGRRIDAFADEHHLGFCSGADTGFLLAAAPDVVRAPDVGFVRADRVQAAAPPRRYFPGPPDLAVEVRSPTDRPADLLRKIADYLAAGTALVWYLDPERRSALVFHGDGRVLSVGADGVLDGEDVLPGFQLRLADVWV